MSALTIITSKGPLLTKVWHSPTEKPRPVQYGKFFRYEEREFDGLAGLDAILRELDGEPTKAVIRGRLKPGLDPNEWHLRRMLGEEATVDDVPRDWVMVDIDEPPLAKVDELQDRLPSELKGVNFAGQLSSSTGHPYLGGKLKLHAWFILDRLLSSAQAKAWLDRVPGVDTSMLTAVGIHYAAAPVMGDAA